MIMFSESGAEVFGRGVYFVEDGMILLAKIFLG